MSTVVEYAMTAGFAKDPTIRGFVSDRITPHRLEEGAEAPAITYQRLAEPRAFGTQEAAGPQDPIFLVSCWADGYDTAHELGDAVKAYLGHGHHAGINASFVLIGDEPFQDPDTQLNARRLHYQVRVEED